MGWAKYAAAAVSLAAFSTVVAQADDAAAWLKDRNARFAAYQAAHPHPDAEIAQIKAKTAALISAYSQPPTSPGSDLALDRAPVIWRVSGVPLELWDGAAYPEMIVVPAGEYTMGSAVTEANRQVSESPRHRVRIGYSFAVSKYPITVGEFAQFVADTHYDAGNRCYTFQDGRLDNRDGRNWRNVGFDQTSTHPAVCLNYNDAKAYAAWLSKKTGHVYRLLSEAEYEYANRAGSTSAYWWGDDPAAACAYANAMDQDAITLKSSGTANTCHDGYVFTSPVGSFKPNGFGLYDTTGDAWSWLSDCWNETYNGAPSDGSANVSGDCRQRSVRAGSLSSLPTTLRSAQRTKVAGDLRHYNYGFRLAGTL